MGRACRVGVGVVSSMLTVSLHVGASLGAEEAATQEPLVQPPPDAGNPFDPNQTYEVFLGLFPGEVDRLSNVLLVGIDTLGPKTYLRFRTLLVNQVEQGWVDLQTVSAILPSPRRLVATPEILLDRQPTLDQEKVKVKEIRSETVREVIR
jgi:hypothetical protein